jgi:hypothetical protein
MYRRSGRSGSPATQSLAPDAPSRSACIPAPVSLPAVAASTWQLATVPIRCQSCCLAVRTDKRQLTPNLRMSHSRAWCREGDSNPHGVAPSGF